MRTVFGSRLIWLVPALGLLACSKGKTNQTAAQQPAAAAPAPAPPPTPAPVTVTLAAKNRSRITGTVVLTAKGDSTAIEVTLNGGHSGTTYPSHIHFGHCDKPGGVVVPLTSVKVGANGSGTSTTMVATSTLDSARAQHGSLLEQSHLPNGRPAACGEIPAK
jgi:hypothetical protein